MRLLAELEAEHRLIERVAGSLRRWADEAAAGRAEAVDLVDFVHFLRVYSGEFHHGREDHVLLPALVEHAEVPADRGPIPVIQAEHRRLEALREVLAGAGSGDEQLAQAVTTAVELARLLWEHIDKEDSVLFPEAFNGLVRSGVRELECREPSDTEAAAARLGEALIERFPPLDDPEIVRGGGCVVCSAFGEACHGIESEWWNSWQWEHYRSMDE